MHRFMSLSRPHAILAGLATLAGLISFMVVASAQNDPVPYEPQSSANTELAEAYFAGGCFWCVEADFDKVDGVTETISGYTGGTLSNPSYKQVTYEDTGHYEAVKVVYDPSLVSYPELVDYFWRHIDPTDAGGQFCDRGASYRTAIFAADAEQRSAAEQSRDAIEQSGVLPGPIVTPILDAGDFWPAEGYHQDYYLKNRLRYNFYRQSCGRDARVNAVWSAERSVSEDS